MSTKNTATIHHLPASEKQLTIEGVMELPEPPIPDDCDLRNFRYMPLDVQRFIDSKFATTVDPASGFFAIQLWAKAWHQLPAGSLPNDDDQLRALSGCGRDTRLWQSVKDGAMYGWVLHSDNRLYHNALTEFALDAYDKLLINREKGRKGGRPRKDTGNTLDNQQDNQEKAVVNPQLFHGKAAVNQEKRIEENRREYNTPYSPPETESTESKPKKEKSASANAIAECVENAFVKLWDGMCLPKVNKTQAARAWKTVCKSKSELEVNNGVLKILAHMAKVKAYVGDRESPFMKTHLATYLNNRKWEEKDMPIIIGASRNSQESRAEVAATNAAKAYEKLFGEKLPSHANCIEGELA